MEFRITITPKNVDKIVQLIRELVYLESSGSMSISGIETKSSSAPAAEPTSAYIVPPPEMKDLPAGKVIGDSPAAEHVGTWGQFNSFFPVKAVLRILAHMMEENSGDSINLQQLVDKSMEVFRATGLSQYRGFPKKVRKESARGRLVWHFITPAYEMGLIRVEEGKGIPIRAWNEIHISLTKEGLEFARLENLLFDKKEREQLLSDVERKWIFNYLKKIDNEGYKEYSFLTRIFEELKNGNTNIAAWLEMDNRFNDYVKSWSRKGNDPKEFKKQVKNVATMFTQSKIALLRELGVISNKRNDYTVIKDLADKGKLK